jgi:diguanylate cyclase (GGDEF)-like protein/PAS domain S-box-containing protein
MTISATTSRIIRTPEHLWQDCVLVAGLIGVLGWLSLTFSRGPDELSAVWFGNGIFVGWLLSRPTPLWGFYLVGGFMADLIARLLSGSPPLHSLLIAMSNLTEVLLVAGTVRKRIPDIGDPKHWLTLGGIATGSTLVACAISGLLAATINTLLAGGSFGASYLTWYAAHVVGMVICATTTLVVHREGRRLIVAPGRGWSFVFTALLILAVSVSIFSVSYPVLFLAYPPLLWAAFRFRFPGVALGIVILTVIGTVATAMGKGPIMLIEGLGTSGHIALLQLYIAGACVMTIPVALVMAERKRLNVRIRDSELRYRMLADYSHDVIVRMRPDGERLYVSPSSRDILGWAPAEMLGGRWELIHPDDRALQKQVMDEVIATGESRTAIYRVQHKDGHYVWIEAVTRPIPSTDRDGMDIIYTGRDISRRMAAEAALAESRRELERMARVDALTDLANRRQFEERLELALLRQQRQGTAVALMYLDVDHFKHINDTWGHAAGDVVLRVFADRLVHCVRATDLVARLGGDEFVVLIEDASLPDAAEVIARKLLSEMRHGIEIDNTTLMATTSIGIAHAKAPTEASMLLATADAALYEAKQAGRNTWRIRQVDAPVRGSGRADR